MKGSQVQVCCIGSTVLPEGCIGQKTSTDGAEQYYRKIARKWLGLPKILGVLRSPQPIPTTHPIHTTRARARTVRMLTRLRRAPEIIHIAPGAMLVQK
jgi:hypothetical protein